MTDRRYDDDEVAEIFRRATEVQRDAGQLLPSTTGMSLAELQEIGKQVGVPAELLADAARSLERREPRFQRTLFGLTVGVGRSVSLDRRVSNEEWERLVVFLRDTFDARGTFRVDGSLRQWTNGNLQVLIEPTEHGDRLRMRTVHANARTLMMMGVGIVSVTAIVAAISVFVGLPDLAEKLRSLLPLALTGGATFGVGWTRLRGWAATRLKQMDDIAARVTAAGSQPGDDAPQLPSGD